MEKMKKGQVFTFHKMTMADLSRRSFMRKINLSLFLTVSLAALVIAVEPLSADERTEDYLTRAQKLANHGKYVEAAAECEKAIELFPDSIKAYNRLLGYIGFQVPLGYRMVKKKLYPTIPPMETMEFVSPAELKPKYDKIRTKINEVKEKMTVRLKKEPRSALLHYVLGLCISSEDNLDMQFNMAEQQYKKNYSAVFKKDEKKETQAMAEWEKAIECDPKFAYAYAALAGVYVFEAEKIHLQRRMRRAAKARKMMDVYARVELGDDLRKMLNGGKEKLQKAVSLDEEYADAHFTLSRVYGLENNLEKQRTHLEKAIVYEPYNALYRFYLGNYYSGLVNQYLHTPFLESRGRARKMAALKKELMARDGVTQEDINRWFWNGIYANETAVKLSSQNSKYFKPKEVEKGTNMMLQMFVIGETLSGDYERIIAVLSKQLRSHPESPSLYSCLGYYYASLYGKDENKENLGQALKCYKKVVELAPDRFRTHIDLVFLYLLKFGEGDENALNKAREEYRWVYENDDTKDGYWRKNLSGMLTLRFGTLVEKNLLKGKKKASRTSGREKKDKKKKERRR